MNKKRSYWVLFAVMVLAGAFFVVDFGLQNQSPRIPIADAQDYFSLSDPTIYSSIPGASFTNFGTIYGSPLDMPASITHPTDLMPTLFTCSGCVSTKSTCNWNCGPTFSNCPSPTGSGYICTGPSPTGSGYICTGPSPTGSGFICTGPSPTGSGFMCTDPTLYACTIFDFQSQSIGTYSVSQPPGM